MRKYFLVWIFIFELAPCFSFSQELFQSLSAYVDPVDEKPLRGWHGPMEDLRKKLDPQKNYVVAVVLKPVNAFLMQNMHHFKSTILASQKDLTENHTGQLGHFQIAWSCRLPGETKPQIGMTSQTGETLNQGVQMLLDGGYGMSLFFANFIDGYLQSSESQAQRILTAKESYGFNWMAVEISEEDCEYGLSYLDTYISRRSYTNFSFAKDPSEFEGGGCTSFGAELFYQFGGVSENLLNLWKTKFYIPKSYLANPEGSELPQKTRLPKFLNKKRYKRHKVNLFKMAYFPNLYLKRFSVLAHIYDTEKILYFFRESLRKVLLQNPNLFSKTYKADKRQAYGLKKDQKTGRVESSAKFDSIEVNENYHKNFKTIKKQIWSKKPSHHLKVEELHGVPGLVVEKRFY